MIKRMLKSLRSKPALLTLTLIYAFAMVIGSTFSWITSSDSRLNQFESGRLSTQISEAFTGTEQWYPGQEVRKVVKVRNTGTSPSIVRVSLSQFLIGFEYDLEKGGTGSLKTTDTPATPLDRRFPATWAAGQTFPAPENHYYTTTAPLSALNFGPDVNGLQSFSVIFGEHVYDSTTLSTKPPGTTDYWYYENGWFYYSQPLIGTDTLTEPLVTAVKMAGQVPYSCQNCLYTLTVSHQSLTPVTDALTDWTAESAPGQADGLTPASPAHTMLTAAIAAAHA